MAFRQLTLGRGAGQPLTTPTAYRPATGQTQFSIPRALLRQAGLADTAGSRFDVLLGEGDDTGKVAIVAGTRIKSAPVGKGEHGLLIRTSGLGKGKTRSKPVSFEIVKDALILDISHLLTPPAPAPREVSFARPVNAQALAA